MRELTDVIEADFRQIVGRVDWGRARRQKILITGASGFLGQYLIGALALANRERRLKISIHAVGLSAPKLLLRLLLRQDKNIVYRRRDLTKPFVLGKYDYVFHAAGYAEPAKFIQDPYRTIALNVNATKEILNRSLRPHGTLVFFSAGSIYGEVPKGMNKIPETYVGGVLPTAPIALYVEAKRLGEALVADAVRIGRAEGRILRISHVYGPGAAPDDSRVMSEFVRHGLAQSRIKLRDAGQSVKTYGYIADVITMILQAAFSGRELVYNVGGEDTLSIKELALRVGRACGAEVILPRTTTRAAHIGSDLKFMRLDLRKIKKEMKNFKFTPFESGLAKTIEWFKYIKKQN